MTRPAPSLPRRGPLARFIPRGVMLAAGLIVAGFAATACGGTSRGLPALAQSDGSASTAAAAWPSVLVGAQREIDRGRHGEADRALRDFATEYPESPEALESHFWRALVMLDPAGTVGTPREAGALLERYLESRTPLVNRVEAQVLQRVARTLAAPRESSSPARAADATRDAELKALKDELEQTKAELERIKKRLAPPPATTTPPPTLR